VSQLESFAHVFETYNTQNSLLVRYICHFLIPRTIGKRLKVNLDRQYVTVYYVLLNMWELQETCIAQIQQYEISNHMMFDYVVETLLFL
jgi:hypothetical protein